MRKIFISISIICAFLSVCPAYCEYIEGVVAKDGINSPNQVIDSTTNAPIGRAKVTLPQKNYKVFTDDNGRFELGANVEGKTVMSVEKEGYRPFSMTIDEKIAAAPMVLGIEKSTPKDIIIDTDMFHLGDNNYSMQSANSHEFKVSSIGPFYSKTFKIPPISPSSKPSLVIGSIIGIDTYLAKSMGQNKITSAYASPPEVFFNGSKIAEIQVNGDGQKIKIPYNLIKPNLPNEVTIKTGKNMAQTDHVDYDDIEFMNLSIQAD